MRPGAAGKPRWQRGAEILWASSWSPWGNGDWCMRWQSLVILSLGQTISQREILEKAGIMHVKPGHQGPLSDTQSGTKKKVVQVSLPQQCKDRARRSHTNWDRNRSIWKTKTTNFTNGSYRRKWSKSSDWFQTLDNCTGRSDLQCSALKIQQVLILDLLMTHAFSPPIYLWQSDAAFSYTVTYLCFSQCTA